jgi:hypothetical protein
LLGAIAYVLAALGTLNVIGEVADEPFALVFVFGGLAIAFVPALLFLGKLAFRHSLSGVLVSCLALIGAVALFAASVSPEGQDDAGRDSAQNKSRGQTQGGDERGGGYVGSDAFLREKLCSEQHPGFTQMDQQQACVQGYP